MKTTFWTITIFFFLSPLIAQENNLKFERLSLEDGLSQSSIHSIFQDRKGFMWFGTEDGLNKYDGYQFEVFKHNPADSHSISHSWIWAIEEDREGYLWLGTWHGLNKYDPAANRFIHYLADPEDPRSLSNNRPSSLALDTLGNLWIGTWGGGLNRYDAVRDDFVHYRHKADDANSLGGDFVRSLYVDRQNIVWVGAWNGLNQLIDPENGKFIRYIPNLTAPDHSGLVRIMRIAEDNNGDIWIGGYGQGVSRLDRKAQRFHHYRHDANNAAGLPGDQALAVSADNIGRIWIGLEDGGLNLFREAQNDFLQFSSDPYNPSSLSSDRISEIYQDRNGALWVGTEDDGINVHNPGKDKFTHFQYSALNPNGLNDNRIYAIIQDKSGIVWIGTKTGGLNRYDPKTKTFTHFTEDPQNPFSLSDNSINAIAEGENGILWIGTDDGGLNRYDPATGRFTHFRFTPGEKNGVNSDNIRTLYFDSRGDLWIGTAASGVSRFELRNNKFTHFRHQPDNALSISSDFIRTISKDRKGRIWIGCWGGGMNRFDAETGRFIRYKPKPGNPNSLSSDIVHAIYEDKQGTYWIGTSGGLNKLFLNEGKGSGEETAAFRHFTENSGLANNIVYGILEEDSVGALWLSTNKGVSRFDPATETFKNYGVGDGLQGNEFNTGAAFKSHTGEMFFGGLKGFNAFYPKHVKENPYVPPIVINAVKKYDALVLRDVSEDQKIALNYDDKYLSFEFAALSYANPEKNQYAYKMEGFDQDWVYAGSRRFVSYTNLEPGDYTFRVKGSNSDGIWNEAGVAVDLSIPSPPWKTWWAYLFYALAIFGIIYQARRYEVNRIRLQNRLKYERLESDRLKELDQMKSRFFTNISHEFRTPLTLILGPVESVMSQVTSARMQQQLQTAFRNGRRLLRLINQLLALSKLEANSMALKASPQNFMPFIKGIFFSFENLAAEKGIKLRFRSDYEAISLYYDAEKLEQVFYNLVSNAVKFTPENANGEVTLTVSQAQSTLLQKLPPNMECIQVIVKDTGAGIAKDRLPHIFDRFFQVDGSQTRSQEGTGIGLALVQEIVNLHYGRVTVQSEPGKGSKFVVLIPLGSAHLKPDEIVVEAAKSDIPGEMYVAETIDSNSEIDIREDQNETPETEEIVLILEDNADMRGFIRQHLEAKYRVLEAADGEAGLEKAIETIPDLIISDVMMPKMDGYTLCNKLKTDERTSHIPVILLTAKAGQESKLTGLETGADDYLTKPFSSPELQVRVKNLIEQRRKLRERFSREVVLKPTEIAITPMDEAFLNRVKTAVEENIGDEFFSVEDLATAVGLSRVQLHRKLKALTDKSTREFILSMRLQRAKDLLDQNAGTVSEIAFMTGFNTSNYFAKCFRKQFNCSPSEYKMQRLV